MPTLISFDPGGTTGVSIISFDESYYSLVETMQIAGGLSGFIRWAGPHDFRQYDVIVCEDFTLRPGVHGADITPAYVIGALEAIVDGVMPVVYQQPSQKKLCGDERLERLEVRKPGVPHANDATRHGIIYLRNKMHLPVLEKGWK